MPESSRAKRRTTELKNNRRGNLRATNGNLEVTYRVTGTTTTQTTTKTYTYTYETTTTQQTVTNTSTFTFNTTKTEFVLSPAVPYNIYSGQVATGQDANRTHASVKKLIGTATNFDGAEPTSMYNEKVEFKEKLGGIQDGTHTFITVSEELNQTDFNVNEPKSTVPNNVPNLSSGAYREIYLYPVWLDQYSRANINSLQFSTRRTSTTTTTTTVTNEIKNTFTNTNTNTNTFTTTKTTTKSATLI